MNITSSPRTRLRVPGLALGLGITLTAATALAHPYATCLTNQSGVVSFRLNEDGGSVKVIGNGGTLTNDLGVRPYGLNVVDLTASGMTSGAFRVEVYKAGTGTPAQINYNSNMLSHFEYPMAVAVNKRPGSPYFGRIYVGNSRGPNTTGSGRLCQDGIYVLNADVTDMGGNSVTNATYYNALTAGINMATGGTSMPWRIRVGEDNDMLYICDWSDASGNLWQTDPDVAPGSGVNVLKSLTGTAAPPVTSANNHGSIAEVVVTGKLSDNNLAVYTVDEDYETWPDYAFMSELNSLWRYDVGAGPLPWNDPPNQKLATPAIGTVSQVMGLDHATNGYFYLLDSRSAGNENMLQVVEPTTQAVLYESRAESLSLGFTYDYLSNGVSVAVSPDMKFCAVLRANGAVVVMPMVEGIPSLAKRFEFYSGTSKNCRQIAFDAADNLYIVSNNSERLKIFSLGLTTTISTGTDGFFSIASPSITVSVTADVNTVSEAAPAQPAIFTLVRTSDDLSQPLPVNFTMSGSAVRGADFGLTTNGVAFSANTVVIPAWASSATVRLWVTNDTTSELTETATLTVAGGGNYNAAEPSTATVALLDDDAQMIDISLVQGSMFEAVGNDYARFRLTRRGDTNAATYSVTTSFSGTAASSRFIAPGPVAIDPGAVTVDFDIKPVNDSLLQGDQTIIAKVAAGAGYVPGTNSTSATATIIDDEVLPETVLWSDNFNTDSTANWTVRAGSVNGVNDYRCLFNYDYASGLMPVTGMAFPVLPPAPHSGTDTHGLYLTANKDDGSDLGAAGVNVYPNGKSFSGNFAVRFDMYLMVGASASTTEYALFGINHSGNATNWFRNTIGGITNGTYDGLFFGVESDAAALGDYVLYSQPTAGATAPVNLTPGVSASSLTGVFKAPPFGYSGAPGNIENSTTPSWTQVEISKVGPYVKLKINNTLIMTYSNATSFTSGNIMLGYCDAYDSIQTGNSGVIYDNVRVVSVEAPKINPASVTFASTNVTTRFSFGLDEPASAFKLQSATTANGPYGDVNATITKLSSGVYTATIATNAAQFFRVRYTP